MKSIFICMCICLSIFTTAIAEETKTKDKGAEQLICVISKGKWVDGVCIKENAPVPPPATMDQKAGHNMLICILSGGKWENNTCIKLATIPKGQPSLPKH